MRLSESEFIEVAPKLAMVKQLSVKSDLSVRDSQFIAHAAIPRAAQPSLQSEGENEHKIASPQEREGPGRQTAPLFACRRRSTSPSRSRATRSSAKSRTRHCRTCRARFTCACVSGSWRAGSRRKRWVWRQPISVQMVKK
eukprot:SAG11_NODE_1255_length_5375_cov_2.966641_6_plen_140_part_00